MEIFWLVLGMLVIVGGVSAVLRRRGYESVEDEPWRASLEDDEPLDMEAIERAEEEHEREEEWRGDEWRGEPW